MTAFYCPARDTSLTFKDCFNTRKLVQTGRTIAHCSECVKTGKWRLLQKDVTIGKGLTAGKEIATQPRKNYSKGRTCSECGCLVTDYNKTGMCKSCGSKVRKALELMKQTKQTETPIEPVTVEVPIENPATECESDATADKSIPNRRVRPKSRGYSRGKKCAQCSEPIGNYNKSGLCLTCFRKSPLMGKRKSAFMHRSKKPSTNTRKNLQNATETIMQIVAEAERMNRLRPLIEKFISVAKELEQAIA